MGPKFWSIGSKGNSCAARNARGVKFTNSVQARTGKILFAFLILHREVSSPVAINVCLGCHLEASCEKRHFRNENADLLWGEKGNERYGPKGQCTSLSIAMHYAAGEGWHVGGGGTSVKTLCSQCLSPITPLLSWPIGGSKLFCCAPEGSAGEIPSRWCRIWNCVSCLVQILLFFRLPELHAEDTAHPAGGRRPLPERLRHDADVLPVALVHADRHVHTQPQHLHQQRQLLLGLCPFHTCVRILAAPFDFLLCDRFSVQTREKNLAFCVLPCRWSGNRRTRRETSGLTSATLATEQVFMCQRAVRATFVTPSCSA